MEDLFPASYGSGTSEAQKTYEVRRQSGFFARYCKGALVLDVGFRGSAGSAAKPAVPHAIGVDLDFPRYDGRRLPFADGSVNTVFSSHCFEHVDDPETVIQDWMRVLKTGGFIVCIVPHQFLYEKRQHLPSRFNPDHKRFFTTASLLHLFESYLAPNSYRVRHCCDNDLWFDYTVPPDVHAIGCYEIELVIEKMQPPTWDLAP